MFIVVMIIIISIIDIADHYYMFIVLENKCSSSRQSVLCPIPLRRNGGGRIGHQRRAEGYRRGDMYISYIYVYIFMYICT